MDWDLLYEKPCGQWGRIVMNKESFCSIKRDCSWRQQWSRPRFSLGGVSDASSELQQTPALISSVSEKPFPCANCCFLFVLVLLGLQYSQVWVNWVVRVLRGRFHRWVTEKYHSKTEREIHRESWLLCTISCRCLEWFFFLKTISHLESFIVIFLLMF